MVFSIFMGLQNANENKFYGFGNLVIWLCTSVEKDLEILLKEIVWALGAHFSNSCSWEIIISNTLSHVKYALRHCFEFSLCMVQEWSINKWHIKCWSIEECLSHNARATGKAIFQYSQNHNLFFQLVAEADGSVEFASLLYLFV